VKYTARVYFSTFVETEVEADSEEEALVRAREKVGITIADHVLTPDILNSNGVIPTLLNNLEECDDADEVTNG